MIRPDVVVALRESAGLSQSEAAARIKREQTWWSRRESGRTKIGFKDIEPIAKALGIPAADLRRQSDSGLIRLAAAPGDVPTGSGVPVVNSWPDGDHDPTRANLVGHTHARTVPRMPNDHPGAMAVAIVDERLSPEYPQSTVIVFEPATVEPDDGDLVAYWYQPGHAETGLRVGWLGGYCELGAILVDARRRVDIIDDGPNVWAFVGVRALTPIRREEPCPTSPHTP